ncbi:MAG: DUF3575 domain-containing protein [Muribaculaceae bacterium]|nr:DUF3575 domain-containing protein [Muribaculaceae bacterium]
MKFLIYPTAILLATLSYLQVHAEKACVPDMRDTLEMSVHFRCARSEVEPNFKNNREILDSLTNTLTKLIETGSEPKIQITGAASPEGGITYNYKLSQRRANAISNYLSNRINFPDSAISFAFLGRDWQGLKRYVEADENVPDREAVIILLESLAEKSGTPGNRPTDGDSEQHDGMKSLKKIGGGRAFGYLYSTYFPTLRATRVLIAEPAWPHLSGISPALPLLEAENMISRRLITMMPYFEQDKAARKPFYMALKTNMLFDAALIPSIGAEFYLGKNISVVANWAYGWWDKNSSHLWWRYYGGDIAARWWFGKAAHEKPLTGHHIGIYGGVFTYDFELGGDGYMGGRPGHWLWDRFLTNAGIEYGYSLPVAKRLNIDFTIGLGYIGGKYIKYYPQGSHYIEESIHKVRWFGPTKAEISLVWLIGHGNTNQKGGSR